jgi:transcriptional regulator with XRE-family HTH domain
MAGNQAVRTYRKKRGLTQKALGKELGVTGVTIYRWERGLRKIDDELLEPVSAKTGIKIPELRPDLAKLLEPTQ